MARPTSPGLEIRLKIRRILFVRCLGFVIWVEGRSVTGSVQSVWATKVCSSQRDS